MIALLLFLVVFFVAYSNGANDNFKGVATLWGSGTASFRRALLWATLTTAAGALCSVLLASTLLKAFSGSGLVPEPILVAPGFLTAVAFGAACTVMLATLTGLPVSTTHALIGGLVGAGAIAAGRDLNLGHLGLAFLLPLITSPILGILLTAGAYRVLHHARLRSGISEESCVCIGQEAAMPQVPNGAGAIAVARPLSVTVGGVQACTRKYNGAVFGLSSQQVVDYAHYLSAGVLSFARGLNDTPKIVALLLGIQALDPRLAVPAVAIGMALGGWLNSRKVAETMSAKITEINTGQGLTANTVTGALVILASLWGLPVSTTHVSVGSIFGISVATGKRNMPVIKSIVLSWVLTLPCAAALSAFTYWLVHGG